MADEDSLAGQSALHRGEGMFLGLGSGDVGHLVAVYRCLDGNYIY